MYAAQEDKNLLNSEKEAKSLEAIGAWVKKRKLEESSKERPMSRVEFVARNNAKMKVIRRRPAKNKPGLEFCGIGAWGF